MYNFNQNEKSPQSQTKEQSKVFIVVAVAIVLILAFFAGKTYWQKRKNVDLFEKIKRESEQEKEVAVDLASPEEVFKSINNEKIQLVDIRDEQEFELKHIESSINLPLYQIKEKIDLLEKQKQIIIIDSHEQLEGKILTDHLKQQGLKAKYLRGGIIAYIRNNFPLINYGNPANTENLLKVDSVTAQELKEELLKGKVFVFVDTRPAGKFKKEKIDGSINIPLEDLEKTKNDLPTGRLAIYDEDPLRSFRAASKLFDMGIISVYNCTDDYATLKEVLFSREEKPQSETESEDKSGADKQ